MSVNYDYKDVLRCLNEHHVKYLIVGGFAVIHHTKPRFTKDLDIWIRPDTENAAATWNALAAFGAPLDELQLTPADFQDEGSIVRIGSPDRDLQAACVEFHAAITGVGSFDDCWRRKSAATLGGVQSPFLGRSDLILAKEAAGRPQDIADLDLLRRFHRRDGLGSERDESK